MGDYFQELLYLLRKDICICLGWDPVKNCKTSHQALWPGGMAILAGIDLIAKFYKGDDATDHGKVGYRFKDFIKKYFKPFSTGDEQAIYQLRNSLLHSFGLYSPSKLRTYHFLLTAGKGPLIQQISPDKYQIDLITLHEKFENAIRDYSRDLENDPILQKNFLSMFTYYGAIRVDKNL